MRWWELWALVFLVAAWCGSAEAQSLPFSLKCPDLTKCGAGESGQWTPSWLVAEHLRDATELRGCFASEDALERELTQVKEAEKWRARAALDLEGELAAERVRRMSTETLLVEQQRVLVRRTRWAWGSTGAASALALILGVVLAL